MFCIFFFSSRRRHTRLQGDWSSDVCSSDLLAIVVGAVVLTGDPRSLRARGAAVAVGYALATGVVIALYTLWDKRSEERRVGKEWRDWGWEEGWKKKERKMKI